MPARRRASTGTAGVPPAFFTWGSPRVDRGQGGGWPAGAGLCGAGVRGIDDIYEPLGHVDPGPRIRNGAYQPGLGEPVQDTPSPCVGYSESLGGNRRRDVGPGEQQVRQRQGIGRATPAQQDTPVLLLELPHLSGAAERIEGLLDDAFKEVVKPCAPVPRRAWPRPSTPRRAGIPAKGPARRTPGQGLGTNARCPLPIGTSCPTGLSSKRVLIDTPVAIGRAFETNRPDCINCHVRQQLLFQITSSCDLDIAHPSMLSLLRVRVGG